MSLRPRRRTRRLPSDEVIAPPSANGTAASPAFHAG